MARPATAVKDAVVAHSEDEWLPKLDRITSTEGLCSSRDPEALFKSVDTDCNGNISLAEFKLLHSRVVAEERELVQNEGRAREEAFTQRKNKVYYQKLASALTLGILLTIGANAAMTAAVVFLSKDMGVNSEGVMVNPITGDALKVSSADTSVSTWGGLVDSNTGKTVQTAESSESRTLDSRLPDSMWQEIKYLEFTSESGGYLHLAVTATVRKPFEPALHGSIVTMYTALGWIELDADIVTFHESMAGVFTSAGFEVAGERRRMSSAFVLIGLFNSVPAFEGWNTTYDSPPKIPETFHAQIEYLHTCKQLDRETGLYEDLCVEHGVPDEFISDEHGTSRTAIAARAGRAYNADAVAAGVAKIQLYARVDAELWADAATSMQRESFGNMPNLWGWTLDRVTSALGAANTQDMAQTWQPTGERFFCRTAPGPKPLSFGSGLWVASYRGELVYNNTGALKFRIKHKQTNNVSVEYMTTVPEDVDGVLTVTTVYPLQIKANLTRADDEKVQEFIINFNTFDALSSVDPSIFSWGLDAPFTNATACESTLNMTTPYDERGFEIGSDGVIPRDMKIVGAAPFMPFLGAPDSTPFFQALRASPYSTAQEIISAIENGTIVLNSTDDIEDNAVVEGRMSISAYVAEQERLDEHNVTDNSTLPIIPEYETTSSPSREGPNYERSRRQLETRQLDSHFQFMHGLINRRIHHDMRQLEEESAIHHDRRHLEHDPLCNEGLFGDGGDDDLCSDSCQLWPLNPFISAAFSPKNGFPCSIEITKPHMCQMSFICEGAVGYFGPLAYTLEASVFLDCSDNFDACNGGGCIALNLGVGTSWAFFNLAYIQVCLRVQNFECNHCSSVATYYTRHCRSYWWYKWWWPGWHLGYTCWWQANHRCLSETTNQVAQFMYQVNVGIDIWFAGLEGTLYIYDNTHCGNDKCNGLYHSEGDNRWGQGRAVRLSGRVWVCHLWCMDVWAGWIV